MVSVLLHLLSLLFFKSSWSQPGKPARGHLMLTPVPLHWQMRLYDSSQLTAACRHSLLQTILSYQYSLHSTCAGCCGACVSLSALD